METFATGEGFIVMYLHEKRGVVDKGTCSGAVFHKFRSVYHRIGKKRNNDFIQVIDSSQISYNCLVNDFIPRKTLEIVPKSAKFVSFVR